MVGCTKYIMGKYVDDFFGVRLHNLQWTTATMFSILCTYVGAPCGPDQAAYHMAQMALLGAQICLDFANLFYYNRFLRDKARKWADEFKVIANAIDRASVLFI